MALNHFSLRNPSPLKPSSRFHRYSPKSTLWSTPKPWPNNTIKLADYKRHSTWSSSNNIRGHRQPVINPEPEKNIFDPPIRLRNPINFQDYREPPLDQDIRAQQDDNVPSSDDDQDLFHWEEETTLFSDLMDETPEDDDAQLTRLTSELQKSFDLHGTDLKKEIAEAFVPIVNVIKDVYRQLEDEVDYKYASGVIAFDKTSKRAELMALHECDEISSAYKQGQTKLKSLLVELEEAYASRDVLWAEYDAGLTAIATPILEMLKDLPAVTESSITNMERHSRQLEREDTTGTTEKKLKALLARG